MTSYDQTVSMEGKMLNIGTSFDEEMGVKASYLVKDVRNWLGY